MRWPSPARAGGAARAKDVRQENQLCCQSDALDGFPGRPTQSRIAGSGSPEMKAVTRDRLNGQCSVVQHRHVHEDRGNLKRSGDADRRALVRREPCYLAAVKPDRSRIGHDLALELCDERGLAGAVRSDDRVNLPVCTERLTLSDAARPPNRFDNPTTSSRRSGDDITVPEMVWLALQTLR